MLFQNMTGTVVSQIKCGEDLFDITQDKSFNCYLNKNHIFSSKINDDSFGSVVGVLVKATSPTPDIVIKSSPLFSTNLKPLLNIINKSDRAKVQVLEDKPDEMAENKPDDKFSLPSIQSYRDKMKKFAESFEIASDLSKVLLKTILPKTMWGSKEVKANLSKMKLSSNEEKEIFEVAAEHTNTKLGHIITCVNNRGLNSIGVKKAVENSVNHISSDFLTMKKMMASFLHTYHNLYASDSFFKKQTGYPATWFFDPSVFYNFTERYEDISENLIEATRAESSVIRPLYAWKIKVTGEN